MAEGIGLLNQRIILIIPWVQIPFPPKFCGDIVQLVERMLCTHKVIGTTPDISKIETFKIYRFYLIKTSKIV